MLLRRLYSSLSQRAATAPSAASAAPKAPTRGHGRRVRVKTTMRVKPAAAPSPSTSGSTSAQPTHGRRLQRSFFSRRDAAASAEGSLRADMNLVSSELPRPAAPGWTPVNLYPAQAALHLGFTPRHMPLPVHIGTQGYMSADAAVPGLWERPAAPSPLEAMPAVDELASSLGEHLRVTKAFAHPALAHHLGPRPTTSLRALDVDADTRLSTLLDEARAVHVDAASAIWDQSLKRMGAANVEPTRSAAEQASIDDAVASLEGLLARLEPSVADEVVEMDSVRRKRKKRMNKHKYKKRRKVSASDGWMTLVVLIRELQWASVPSRPQPSLWQKLTPQATRAERKRLGK